MCGALFKTRIIMPVIDESQARRATQVNQENNASYTQAFRNQRQDIGLSEILTEIQRIAGGRNIGKCASGCIVINRVIGGG